MSIFIYAAIAVAVLFTAVAMAQASTGASVFVYDPTDKVRKFANAIGFAEGAWDINLHPHYDSRPYRNNNPGDFLGAGDGGRDGAYAVYTTMDKGLARLYGQLTMIVNGSSSNYNLDETVSDMAYTWTSTEQDSWSENVALFLGVTRDTPLRGLLT